MKLQTCVAVIVASVLVLCVLVSANNITWGQIGPNDYIAAREYVIRDANWFTKHKEVVNYPPKVNDF